MLRLRLAGLVILSAQVLAAAEPQAILLWPNGAPGSEGKTTEEVVEKTASGERNVTGIHKPSLTPYLPEAGKANGAAIVVAPGGGHSKLCVDHEGHNLARWLAEHGVAAFVLKYRLSREKDSTYTLDGHAVSDMQRAIRLVRQRAAEWKVDPQKVGALRFFPDSDFRVRFGEFADSPIAGSAGAEKGCAESSLRQNVLKTFSRR